MVTPEDLPKRLRHKDFKGIDQERELGGLILHMFNHQTHHKLGRLGPRWCSLVPPAENA